MRLRLFLAFTFIILITLGAVAFFASQGAAREVQSYLNYGGPFVDPNLVERLEAHYRQQGTWEGAASLMPGPSMPAGRGPGPHRGMAILPPRQGMGMLLVDAQGNVVYDPANPDATGNPVQGDLDRGTPLMVNGQVVGYLLPPSQEDLFSRLNQASLNAALIAGGIALALAIGLAHFLLRPVRQLTKAATRLAEGDLSHRVSAGGSDEMATLGKAFNHMAESLEEAEARRRAMTADIAHELRTPLAVQRANLEALQDGVYPLTQENLKPVSEQNRLLNHLVEDLGTLALVDAGELELDMVPTDLRNVARKVASGFQSQAGRNQVKIALDLPDTLPSVEVDPLRVEQILNNLLQNGLRHTPEGGRIYVRLQEGRSKVKLTVQDSGTGIPDEALPHIFERFYRADRSRSRGEGGRGLGLAIARKLAEAQGGTLQAGNAPEGGAVFTLSFPHDTGQ